MRKITIGFFSILWTWLIRLGSGLHFDDVQLTGGFLENGSQDDHYDVWPYPFQSCPARYRRFRF